MHRDIKPSNLLLDGQSVVWVADFGLAKFVDDGHTRTSDIVGTLRYMSPERFQGISRAQADIYSLGATLYEMVLLPPAFEATNQLELIDEIPRVSPQPIRSVDPCVPRDLETIIMKAMAKEPSDRYQHAGEMADDLQKFLMDEPILARRVSLPERFVRWTRRNRAVAALVATVFSLLAAVAGLTSLWAHSAENQRQHEEIARREAERLQHEAEEARDETREARDDLAEQLYVADLRLIQQSFEDGNVEILKSLLRKHIPLPGEHDVRTWEWYYWWRTAGTLDNQFDCSAMDEIRWGFNCLAISPNQKQAAVGQVLGRVSIVDIQQQKVVRQLTSNAENDVADVTYCRDGEILIAGGVGNKLLTWNTADWQRGRDVELPSRCRCFAAAKSTSRGELLAVATSDEDILVLQTSNWEIVQSLECGPQIQCIAFSPSGDQVAVGHGSGLSLWDAHQWKRLTVKKPLPSVRSLAFSPDNRWLAIGTENRHLYLIDAQSHELEHVWDTRMPPASAAFSADSQLLAVGTSNDNSILVWDVETRSLVSTKKGHAYHLSAIRFLENPRELLSVGFDNSGIRLWTENDVANRPWQLGEYSKLEASRPGRVRGEAGTWIWETEGNG